MVVGFEEFLALRLGALLRYTTVLTCDPVLADDIVQEVLVRAGARWSRIAEMERPEAYLKRMLLNEFLSWRRRSHRLVPVTQDVLDRIPSAVDPHAVADERAALIQLVAALPPRQRAVIVLRYFEGNTDDEIADLLNCRPPTVRVHASRALTTMRGAMRETAAAEHRGDETR